MTETPEPSAADRAADERATDVDHRAIDDSTRPIHAAADAANVASRDAESAARSAADTTLAAQEALVEATGVAARARHATATTVAAAAWSTADIAARAASAVEAEAVTRALSVAASALAALDTITSQPAEEFDHDAAAQAAASVAAMFAADVVDQERATAVAASMVAAAVTLAAEAAALAAKTAAATVAMAAGTAAAKGDEVAESSAATGAASDLAVASSSRVAALALNRVALLREAPLVAELQAALADGDLRLHYQPMYDMGTGDLIAVEALLRWQHPERGLLLPVDFVNVVENHPLLTTPVGDWVLATAVSQAAGWQQAFGVQAPAMWVNLSCDQLGRQHLPGVIERLLSLTGFAGKLGLEITERQLARRVDDVAADLLALRDLGVCLAVDDFGTGYASLDYLRRFAFDEIKIDRSFVSGLGRDKTDTAVISSIIALGRSLDLTVVAEGVETQEQFDHLQQLGCDVSQGYLHHRPATAQSITELLASGTTETGS